MTNSPNGSNGAMGGNNGSPSATNGNGGQQSGVTSPDQNGVSSNPQMDNGSSSSSSSSTHYRDHVVIPAAVVCSVVGAVLLALLICLLCIFLRRRRKQKEKQATTEHTGPDAAAFAALGGTGSRVSDHHTTEKPSAATEAVGTGALVAGGAAAVGDMKTGHSSTSSNEKVAISPFADQDDPNFTYGTRSKAEAVLGGGALVGARAAAGAGEPAAKRSRPSDHARHPSQGQEPVHELGDVPAPVPAASARTSRSSLSSKFPRMRQPTHYTPPPTAPPVPATATTAGASLQPPQLPRLSSELGTGTWLTSGDTPRSDSDAYPSSTTDDPFMTPSAGSARSVTTGGGGGVGGARTSDVPMVSTGGLGESSIAINTDETEVIPGPWPGHHLTSEYEEGPSQLRHGQVGEGEAPAPRDIPERSPNRHVTSWVYPSPREAEAFDFELEDREEEARHSIPRKPVPDRSSWDPEE